MLFTSQSQTLSVCHFCLGLPVNTGFIRAENSCLMLVLLSSWFRSKSKKTSFKFWCKWLDIQLWNNTLWPYVVCLLAVCNEPHLPPFQDIHNIMTRLEQTWMSLVVTERADWERYFFQTEAITSNKLEESWWMAGYQQLQWCIASNATLVEDLLSCLPKTLPEKKLNSCHRRERSCGCDVVPSNMNYNIYWVWGLCGSIWAMWGWMSKVSYRSILAQVAHFLLYDKVKWTERIWWNCDCKSFSNV